jgi:hypothetical protein
MENAVRAETLQFARGLRHGSEVAPNFCVRSARIEMM